MGNVSRPDLHFSGQQELDLPVNPCSIATARRARHLVCGGLSGCSPLLPSQHLTCFGLIPHCCQKGLTAFPYLNEACEQPPHSIFILVAAVSGSRRFFSGPPPAVPGTAACLHVSEGPSCTPSATSKAKARTTRTTCLLLAERGERNQLQGTGCRGCVCAHPLSTLGCTHHGEHWDPSVSRLLLRPHHWLTSR